MQYKNKFLLPLNLQLFAEEQTVDAGNAEAAAPQTETSNETAEVQGDESTIQTEAPVVEDAKPKQTPEQDAAFAQLRREKEAAEKQAKQMDDFIRQNYGHLGIQTLDQLQAYQQKQQEEVYRQQWEERGFDPEEINQLLNDHPVIKQSQKVLQDAQEKAALSELNTAYPDLKLNTLEDVVKLPNAEQIIDRVKKGYSLKDAYELSNQNEIIEKKVQAALQAQLNNINGKGHLKPNANDGGGNIDTTIIPPETLDQYRKLIPGKPDSFYIEHYKRSIGG